MILAATKLMSSRPAKFKNDRKNMFPERFRKYRLVVFFMTPKPEDGAFDRVNRSSPSLPTPSKTENEADLTHFNEINVVLLDGELRFRESKAPSSGFGVIKQITKRYFLKRSGNMFFRSFLNFAGLDDINFVAAKITVHRWFLLHG